MFVLLWWCWFFVEFFWGLLGCCCVIRWWCWLVFVWWWDRLRSVLMGWCYYFLVVLVMDLVVWLVWCVVNLVGWFVWFWWWYFLVVWCFFLGLVLVWLFSFLIWLCGLIWFRCWLLWFDCCCWLLMCLVFVCRWCRSLGWCLGCWGLLYWRCCVSCMNLVRVWVLVILVFVRFGGV